MTDPRYLDATIEEMITAYWERHYDDLRLAGRSDEVEDEDESFDLDEIERLMAEHPDDWFDVVAAKVE